MGKNKRQKRKEKRREREEKMRERKLQRNINKGKKKGTRMSNQSVRPLTDAELADLIEKHNKGGAFKSVAVTQTCWDAGITIKKGCNHMEKPKFHVDFELVADQKIKKLQDFYPSLEWLAYLVGTVDHEKQVVTVEDLVIPDSQQVTGTNVHNVEYTWPKLENDKMIIGVIHSHHRMGAFFSGTDDAYINQNHDVSIVVATAPGREIMGQVRVKTPCNEYVLAENLTFATKQPTLGDLDESQLESVTPKNFSFGQPVTFAVKQPSVVDLDAFEKEFDAKISTYSYTAPIRYVGNSYGGFTGGQGSFNFNRFDRRNSGNPPRTYNIYDEDDGTKLTDTQIRVELEKFYSAEEVQEFFDKGEAKEELATLKELEGHGLHLLPGNGAVDDFEIDVDSVWGELEDQYDSTDWPDTDTHSQLGQTQRGVPLGDSEDEDSVWDLTEDDFEFEDEEDLADDILYAQVDDMTDEEREKVLLTVYTPDQISDFHMDGTTMDKCYDVLKNTEQEVEVTEIVLVDVEEDEVGLKTGTGDTVH